MNNRMTPTPRAEDTWLQPGSALYVQVRARIVGAIRSGEWPSGQAIPPERVLCERFGVSIGTLRKAVDELTASGILVRRQGRGTFVARHSEGRYLFSFFHLVLTDGRKEYPSVRFNQFAPTLADERAAKALNVALGAPLWHLQNVLSLGGQIASVDDIFLPQSRYENLSENTLRERDTTLYQLYQDQFGVAIIRTQECVHAAAAAAPYTKLLKVTAGTPLLAITRTAFSFEDAPVELRISHVNTQHCQYCPTALSEG